MMKLIRALGVAALAATAGGCWGDNGQYLHRADTITLGAGNAANINAATHVIDPWPPRVANRRIPANGERMVGAVERYRGRQAPGGQGGAQPNAGSAATAPGLTPSSGSAAPSSTLPY
jgi:hypothetical protein